MPDEQIAWAILGPRRAFGGRKSRATGGSASAPRAVMLLRVEPAILWSGAISPDRDPDRELLRYLAERLGVPLVAIPVAALPQPTARDAAGVSDAQAGSPLDAVAAEAVADATVIWPNSMRADLAHHCLHRLGHQAANPRRVTGHHKSNEPLDRTGQGAWRALPTHRPRAPPTSRRARQHVKCRA